VLDSPSCTAIFTDMQVRVARSVFSSGAQLLLLPPAEPPLAEPPGQTLGLLLLLFVQIRLVRVVNLVKVLARGDWPRTPAGATCQQGPGELRPQSRSGGWWCCVSTEQGYNMGLKSDTLRWSCKA